MPGQSQEALQFLLVQLACEGSIDFVILDQAMLRQAKTMLQDNACFAPKQQLGEDSDCRL